MRVLFPCARGEQPLGYAEVCAGSVHDTRLPKAFGARQVSMTWELLRQKGLLEGNCPLFTWQPFASEGVEDHALMRGGSSANFATLLAALRHEHDDGPQSFSDALGRPLELWASGELNPSSETSFLQPVGEIETKVEHFLRHCSHHGPALFLAPIGNRNELHRVRERYGDRFEELRFYAGMEPLEQLRKPTILWVGCTRLQFTSFASWTLGRKYSASLPARRSRMLIGALATLAVFLMAALGYALVRSSQYKREAIQARKALTQHQTRSQRTLLHMHRLLQALVHKQGEVDISGQNKQLRVLLHKMRNTEDLLRRSLRGQNYRQSLAWKRLLRGQKKLAAMSRYVQPAQRVVAPPAKAGASVALTPKAKKRPRKPLSPLCQRKKYPMIRSLMRPALYRRFVLREGSIFPKNIPLMGASIAPNQRRLVVASYSKAHVRNMASGSSVMTLSGHRGVITVLNYSPNGERILTGSADRTMRLWDAKSGQLKAVLRGHQGIVHAAAFLSSKVLMSVGGDRTIRRWDGRTGKLLKTLKAPWNWATFIAFSQSGRQLVTTGLERTAHLWNPLSGRRLAVLRGHQERVRYAAFSRKGRFLATVGLDRTARIWDVATGKPLTPLLQHRIRIYRASFSPDNRLLTTASAHAIHVWDTCASKHLMSLSHRRDMIRFLKFTPDGQYLVTGSHSGALRLYHPP